MAEQAPNTLSPELWKSLERIRSMRTYAKGASLFQQGRPTRGIYFIEKGEVRLLLPSESRSPQLFEVAGPGSVLALSEALTGEPHKLTAEAAASTKISFVTRRDLLRVLRDHHELCLQVVRLLSEDLHVLYRRYRTMEQSEARPGRKRVSARIQ